MCKTNSTLVLLNRTHLVLAFSGLAKGLQPMFDINSISNRKITNIAKAIINFIMSDYHIFFYFLHLGTISYKLFTDVAGI